MASLYLVIFLLFGMSYLPMTWSSPAYCSVDDLKPGLKYDGAYSGRRAVGYQGLMYVLCYDIYEPSEATVRCRGPGRWSKEVPPCTHIFCDSPARVTEGGFYLSGRKVGDLVTMTCKEGFWYNGTNPRVCQRNRTWTGRDGQCLAIQCPPLPPPLYGSISPPPPYKYRDKIKVSCEDGFVYTGSQEHVCQVNNMWGGTQGICTQKDSVRCEMDALENSIVIPEMEVGRYESTIYITCSKGFTYNGTETRMCQADGTWSGTPGQCNVKTCKAFEVEITNSTAWGGKENAMVLISDFIPMNSTTTQTSDVFKYGDIIEVKCHPGYIYDGAPLMCNEHGQWEGRRGLCTAVPCLEDPMISNGSIKGSGYAYKDETNIECDRGFELDGSSPHAVCTADGTWQINAQCVAVPCLDPPPIADADFEGSGYVYGDEVNVTCNSGHTWDGSTPHATCRHDGTWQVNGECRALGVKDVVLAVVPALIALLAIVLGLPISIRIYRQWSKPEQGVEDEENFLLGDVNEERNSPVEVATPDSLKKAVITRGHVINRNPDRRINLDNQFVKLRVVTGEGYDRMDEINDALPDRYQDYLQRAGAENIEMEDILNHVKEETVDGVTRRMPLLMEGRAGVGKSTLVQKLMRLWAQNVWAKDYKAAFLFNIRNLTVHDKRKITLEDLFRFYSLYTTKEGSGSIQNEFLQNEEGNILIFIDGIDEFPGLMENLKDFGILKITDVGEPVQWCINLLRRNVMGKSALILASRPFKDLKYLDCSPMVEVVGLTQETILHFIDHHVEAEKIERVKNSMMSNQLVMSVSSITYFCMMFCTVLEEDETISTAELTTYTRITAFFIEHYMKRCKSPQHGEVSRDKLVLRPLTKLAYRGLIERNEMSNKVRLVFDQMDLDTAGVTGKTRQISEDCGILVTSVVNLPNAAGTKQLQNSEFVHLSVQEFLAMLELLKQSERITISAAYMMWRSGSFLMAQQYLYGLCYDKANRHITNLLHGSEHGYSRPGREGSEGREVDDLVTGLINRLTSDIRESTGTKSKLQAIQMVYETQRDDVAERVSKVIFNDSNEMFIHDTLLTAVDVNAIVFMLSKVHIKYKLSFESITMDSSSAILLAENLVKCKTLQGFSFKKTKLSPSAVSKLVDGLARKKMLHGLVLEYVGLCEETEGDIFNALRQMSNLTKLSLEGSRWSGAGIKALGEGLKGITNLKELHLTNAGLGGRTVDVIAALKVLNITKLSLNGNPLTEEVVKHLADWLRDDSSLQHLNLANTGMVYDLVKILLEAVNTNHTLKMLDIRGEKIKGTLHGLLKKNTTMEALWYSDSEGDTCRTVIPVAGTNRRMEVSASPNGTQFISWCLQDLVTSSALLHPHVVWSERSSDLYLNLEDRYTDLYGAERPPVTTDTWCHTLNQLTSSTHRVGVLYVFLSNSASLSPLLSSLTHDMIHTLIHSQVGRVEVYDGEVTCSDLLTWLSSLSSQPGWSVRAHAGGTEVTNTHSGQSVVINLVYTRVLASLHQKQQHQEHLGEGEIRLLQQPEWIIQ